MDLITLSTKIRVIADRLVAQIEAKNRDYGDSYARTREKYGPLAFQIRAEDKLNRLESLTGKEPAVVGEATHDTIQDLAGYCILELAYRELCPDIVRGAQ